MTINIFKILKANKLNLDLSNIIALFYDSSILISFIISELLLIFLLIFFSYYFSFYYLLICISFVTYFLVKHLNAYILKQPFLLIDLNNRMVENCITREKISLDNSYFFKRDRTLWIPSFFKWVFDIFSYVFLNHDTITTTPLEFSQGATLSKLVLISKNNNQPLFSEYFMFIENSDQIKWKIIDAQNS